MQHLAPIDGSLGGCNPAWFRCMHCELCAAPRRKDAALRPLTEPTFKLHRTEAVEASETWSRVTGSILFGSSAPPDAPVESPGSRRSSAVLQPEGRSGSSAIKPFMVERRAISDIIRRNAATHHADGPPFAGSGGSDMGGNSRRPTERGPWIHPSVNIFLVLQRVERMVQLVERTAWKGVQGRIHASCMFPAALGQNNQRVIPWEPGT